MKHNVSLLTGALLIAVASGAFAQTAVTDPVGYITLPVAGGGTNSSPALSYVGASLVNKIEVSAVSTAGGNNNSAEFAAGVLPAAGTYGLNTTGQANYYVEIASGPNAGVWTDITANTTTSITLFDAIGNNAHSQTLKIRKHHTLSSLFGATAATVQLKQGLSIGTADELLVIENPTGNVAKTFFFSTDDADFDGNPDGWVNSANGNPLTAVQKQLPEGTALAIKRKGAPFNWVVPAETIAP